MSQQLDTYISYWNLNKDEESFINDFKNLYIMTKNIFGNVILITSISNNKNHLNIAIDTSNTSKQSHEINNEYKVCIHDFIAPYVSKEIFKKIIEFSSLSKDTINIGFNMTSTGIDFNICYTSRYINHSCIRKVAKFYKLPIFGHSERNFLCLNVSQKSIKSIKHYQIDNLYKNSIDNIYKLLSLFSILGDTYMLLDRYSQGKISHKAYLNTYHSGLYNTDTTKKKLKKLGFYTTENVLIQISKSTRIGAIASIGGTDLEIYYILEE